MITAKQAEAIAVAYVSENRPGAEFVGLYQDGSDFLIDINYPGQAPVGTAWMFVSKANGAVREVAPGLGVDKAMAMNPVTASASA